MKTIITTNNQSTNNENNFTTLLRAWECVNTNNATETEKTEVLMSLAYGCTYSVLKKLYNVSCQKTIKELQIGIAKDKTNLDRVAVLVNEMYTYCKDENGNTICKVDTYKENAISKLLHETITEGTDLVHTAIIAILEETQKALDRIANGETYEHETNIDKDIAMFMEYAYPKRQLKKKVLIKDEHNANCYEYKPTTPIQEVYKAIRREVENNRAVQVANGKYVYIEVETGRTDSNEKLYRRLPKYSGLATEETKTSYTNYGQTANTTVTTASTYDVDRVEKIISRLNLTERQAEVLQLRLCGYGYKAIATYLGVTQRAIAKTVQAIQTKANNIGLTTGE